MFREHSRFIKIGQE